MRTSTGALAGCCGFCGSRRRYVQVLRLVEVQETFRSPLRADTLKRWRTEAPDDFVFSIRAPQLITHQPPPGGFLGFPRTRSETDEYGFFQTSPALLSAYDETLAAAQLLAARAIVFDTPMDFTPTAANRKKIADFFSIIPREDQWLVWQPQGVWSDAEVARICSDLDLVPAIPRGSLRAVARCYLRLNAPRHSDDELLSLAEQMRCCDTAFCVFNNPSRYRDAQRLQSLL